MCSTATPPPPSIRRGNTRASRRSSARHTQFYGWHYPPYFLGLAALLAAMPYALALALWQGVTFALYLWVTRAILSTGRARALADPLWLPLVIGFPAVFVNLGHGHNGFLTAALFGAALLQLDRKPVLAGVLFGCIAYKPQFGLLVSHRARGKRTVAGLYCRGHDGRCTDDSGHARVRSSISGRLSRLGQVHARRRVEQGETGWHKIQSVFRWCGCGAVEFRLAYAVQVAVTLAVAGGLVWLWRSSLFPDQGGSASDRHNPRNALQPRLRPYAARASHCVPRRGRDAEGFPSVAKIPAGSAVARTDLARPVFAGDIDPARGSRDAGGFSWLLRRAMTQTGTTTLWHLRCAAEERCPNGIEFFYSPLWRTARSLVAAAANDLTFSLCTEGFPAL